MVKYTVYETTNLISRKYYLGIHRTKKSHDSYLGSGAYIKQAVAKYGKENFVKVVLCIFDTKLEALDKERELVEIHRHDPLCMNMTAGGLGGWEEVNSRVDIDRRAIALSALECRKRLIEENPQLLVEWGQAAGRAAKRGQILAARTWKGCKHTPETCTRMSEARRGERNTFSGRKWMLHPEFGSKPVKKDEIEAHQLSGWVFGRKC